MSENNEKDSGQSSNSPSNKINLPPINRLPLRKRLVLEKTPKKVVNEYPPTPPNSNDPPKIIKQPLKKSYTWISTRGKTTVVINKTTNIKNLNHIGGNPLLWNNGHKYEPEETIDSFKTAWLNGNREEEEEEEDEDEDEAEEQEELEAEEVKKLKKAANSKRGRPPVTKQFKEESISINQDGKLYCICRQLYDATRFMIACDKCDDWFHGECIGINEKESEFIDLYFCNKCSKMTGKKTSWKPNCSNPACYKAGRIGSNLGYISKYCSDSCGMQVARARIELAEIKRSRTNETSSRSIAELSLKKQREIHINSLSDKEDRKILVGIRTEKRAIRDNLYIINKKFKLLQEIEQTSNSTQCNFDTRFIWPDKCWIEPVKYTVCQQTNCLQHQQWQSIMLLQIEQEKQEQYKLLLNLENQRSQIKARMRQRRDDENLLENDYLINTTIEL